MNSTQFAHAWLEQHGLFNKDSDYDGWLGRCVEETWGFIALQGHSGASAAQLFDILSRIYIDYSNGEHPIWQAYWESDEGKRLKAAFMSGGETLTETPCPPPDYNL